MKTAETNVGGLHAITEKNAAVDASTKISIADESIATVVEERIVMKKELKDVSGTVNAIVTAVKERMKQDQSVKRDIVKGKKDTKGEMKINTMSEEKGVNVDDLMPKTDLKSGNLLTSIKKEEELSKS